MKIKSECKLREMAGEWVVISLGRSTVDLTRIITLNTTSRLLWQELGSREFTLEDVVDILCQNFEVDADVARRDAQVWLEKLSKAELLE